MRDLTLYEQHRDEIIKAGTGSCLLWANNTLLAKAIELFSKESELLPQAVNHASVLVILQGIASGIMRVFNYESLDMGFAPHYLSTELSVYGGSVFWLKLKDNVDVADIEERAFKYDGTRYGYGQLLTFPWKRPEISLNEMICSESVEVVVTGKTVGQVHAPGELPDLGYWEAPVQIL